MWLVGVREGGQEGVDGETDAVDGQAVLEVAIADVHPDAVATVGARGEGKLWLRRAARMRRSRSMM